MMEMLQTWLSSAQPVLAQIQIILGWGLVLTGCFFTFSGALGMIRFPDFYTRLHAAGLKDAAGAPLILFGVLLLMGFSLLSLKILLLMVALLITSPTATHAVAKAAILEGMQPKLDSKELNAPPAYLKMDEEENGGIS